MTIPLGKKLERLGFEVGAEPGYYSPTRFRGPATTHVIGRRPTDSADRWLLRLDVPLAYRALDGRVFLAEEGLLSDLNSTPWWSRSIYAVAGATWSETARTGILHDAAYAMGPRWPWWTAEGHPRVGVTRAEADALHREALRVGDGRARWVAWSMWTGLRAGGWHSWGEYRAAEG